MLIVLAALFVVGIVTYFVWWRPRQRRRREAQALDSQYYGGDPTAGGTAVVYTADGQYVHGGVPPMAQAGYPPQTQTVYPANAYPAGELYPTK